MKPLAHDIWLKENQRYLMAAVAAVRAQLQAYSGSKSEYPQANSKVEEVSANQNLSPPPALETLCRIFNLSGFERTILLLCAGAELDSSFADLIAATQGYPSRTAPVFSLALSVLPDAHWSALAPTAPLRRWRFIELGTGHQITQRPLQIDERILHFLSGVSYLDCRLRGMISPAQVGQVLIDTHRKLAEHITKVWRTTASTSARPVIQLTGEHYSSKPSIAVAACAAIGLQLHVIQGTDIPANATEREALSRLWEREAALSESALLVDCETTEQQRTINLFLENTRSLLIVSTCEALSLNGRPAISIEVPKPGTREQLILWQQALGPKAKKLNGQLEHLTWQFQLDEQDVNAVSAQLIETYPPLEADEFSAKLWQACRIQARKRLDELAQRIEPLARWDDLVLPEAQINLLREIAMHVRQRAKVYESWGFAAKTSRGLGISALFAGPSGTGKTMAAEVLANELNLDLYRIDLSQVINKYIGETEKNLRRVFDAAEHSGAILLFDEADALFGKRSDIKDSHDRYSNIECSYLLQRMETYRGLAILTTNMKQALDQAFLRRIRFAVQFPFPGAEQRAEIWRRIFPRQMPTENLNVSILARLDIAGGNIRNIAMNAAFLAADMNQAVGMAHIEQAARREYMKLEKPMTGNELASHRQKPVINQKPMPENQKQRTARS